MTRSFNKPQSFKPDSELKFVVENCRAFSNKVAELQSLIHLFELDIFLGTEFHLDNSYFNSDLFSCKHNVYRKDRNKHGGGVFILVNNTIPSFQIEVDSPLELIWVYLHVNTQADIIFGCFYCPPHSPVSDLDHHYQP